MQNDQFSLIESVNYWQNLPKNAQYVRQSYLNLILSYLETPLLKVLVGQRRCGKSTLLKQVINKLLVEGVPNENILYLNFELHELQWIKAEVISH